MSPPRLGMARPCSDAPRSAKVLRRARIGYAPARLPALDPRSPMRYGLNLFLWTTDVRDEHLPLLDQAREYGYDGVEVPIGSAMSSRPERLREALDEAGMACTTMTNV